MKHDVTQRAAMRGVSLIEALVALAVMAFGLLGVVGMQATLRSNGDVSKQRAEAVRMAQEQIEDWRAFARLTAAPGPPPVASFADISSMGGMAVTGYAITNATYTRSADVGNAAPGTDDPQLKSVKVEVNWLDRAGNTASVQLVSAVAGVAPELAGSLGLPADRAATQRPGGRHAAVPPGAVDQGDGTSRFSPPVPTGAAEVRWIFNNQSGFITRVCNPVPQCTDTTLLPLSGFVRFALGTVQPTGSDAENPPPTGTDALAVQVLPTLPAGAAVACYTQTILNYVAYFCGMPVTTAIPNRWSGRTQVVLSDVSLSPSMADATPSRRKVCRYTPDRTHTPVGGNRSHPLDYVNVTEPLSNQNFLVIRGGNGSVAFDCPPDDTSTEFVNGNTYRHQPDA